MADLAYANDDSGIDDSVEAPAQEQPAAVKLAQLLQSPNLVTELDAMKLSEISRKAIDGYHLDDDSRKDWKERTKAAMDLAMMLTEEKNYPFMGAANVKHPLLTTAALQFNARAYPAIVPDGNVAKCKVNGHDEDGEKLKRADRVSEHLSWQLTSEMPEWEEDTDRLLMIISIPGSIFRKTYYDPTLGRKCSRLILASRLVVNYYSRSLEDVPRISEEMWLYPHEIEERIRDGRFIDFEYGDAKPDDENPNETSTPDADGPHKFIEQHRLIDLDGDDYPEPYIVTIHLESEKVCRIVPNFTMDTVRVTPDGQIAAIRKQDYYTKYVFMQSPDGGAYGLGLGSLLLSTNEAINTTLNLMLDSGHLSNLQGGFISAQAGIREKNIKLSKGEWKVLNTTGPLNQSIFPMKYDGPSETLFQLLGFLVEMGKEVSAVKDVLTGDTGGKVMQPTTVLALIEQGEKVYNAIFKRIHRSLKHELKMHGRLNFEHLTPEAYNEFFDDPTQQFDPKADYNLDDMNITPVSDPTVSTPMQKLAKSQIIAEIANQNPAVNQEEATRRRFAAAEIEDIDKLMVPPQQIDPKTQAFQDAMRQMTLLEAAEKIGKLETAQILDIANAAGVEGDQALALFAQFVSSLETQHNMELSQNAQQQAALGGQGGLPGMAGSSGDGMGNGLPEAAGGGGSAADTGNPVQSTPQPAGAIPGAPTAASPPGGAG